MGSRDPRVDAYIGQSAPFAGPILTHIRKVVHAGCPEVEETMKWSFPHFMYKGILCSMASFKAHCALGFWKGSLLTDIAGAKPADAMGQFGRITAVADLPGERALTSLVRKAAALNDQGVKAPRTPKAAPRPAPDTPPEMLKALKGSKKASATWEALPPSHRREYLEWITEAKTDTTRQRRVETAVGWLAEGKSRNWKYERP
ncbi:MAG: YdeI/OmpD-associated family protein [Acidobacteriota bacterium]